MEHPQLCVCVHIVMAVCQYSPHAFAVLALLTMDDRRVARRCRRLRSCFLMAAIASSCGVVVVLLFCLLAAFLASLALRVRARSALCRSLTPAAVRASTKVRS